MTSKTKLSLPGVGYPWEYPVGNPNFIPLCCLVIDTLQGFYLYITAKNIIVIVLTF